MSNTCRDINELKPLARQACNLFLSECKDAKLNIFITETYRGQARQNELYAQGRTTSGKIVTWTKTSNHTSRMAWDIACSPPLALYDVSTIKKTGIIARQLGITWGGSWTTPDMPHFEIKDNWKMPIIESEVEEMEKIYNKINDLPDWAQSTIQKLINKKYISGDGSGLGLSETALKVLVINDRAGLYDGAK